MGHSAPLVSQQKGLAVALKKLLGKDMLAHDLIVGEDSITVKRDALGSAMRALRDGLEYQQLVEIAGVDYPNREERFEVVYHLLSITKNHRLRVRVSASEATPVPSVTGVWPNAGWLEREVFDMYGVLFSGNSDLRRILTDYGFQGHPQRKDFPLTGYIELRYSEEDKRVVYEPVKLAQDFRSFDFMSPWEGADYILPGDEKAGGTGEAPGKGAPTPMTAKEVKKADAGPKVAPPPTPKTTEKADETGEAKVTGKPKVKMAAAKKKTVAKKRAKPKSVTSRAKPPKGGDA